MKNLLNIVASFAKTIGIEMSLNKCAVVYVKRGKIQEGEELTVMEDITIPRLKVNEHYE